MNWDYNQFLNDATNEERSSKSRRSYWFSQSGETLSQSITCSQTRWQICDREVQGHESRRLEQRVTQRGSEQDEEAEHQQSRVQILILIIESHASSLPKDIASDKEEEAGDQVRAPQIHRAWAIADARSEIRYYPSPFHFNCKLLRCHSQDAQQKGVSDSTEIQTLDRVRLRPWAILDKWLWKRQSKNP